MTIQGKLPNTTEVWKDIPGYNGKYQVSLSGVVRSVYRYKGKNLCAHYKTRKADKGSYLLSINGIDKKYCVDYLIDITFGVQHIHSLEGEIWKPIAGYEGYYKVSNYGRILAERRLLVRKNGVIQFCKEQIVQAKTVINSGYGIVNLHKDKHLQKFLIHRLVAEHFVENPNGYEFVNHKDENKLNNHADNLEWCTKQYNRKYGTAEQRRIATRLKNNNGKYGYKRKVNR
jgi:hypothetical protein